MNEHIIRDIGVMTAIIIKNHITEIVVDARVNPGEDKATGYLLREHGRVLLHTDPEFDTVELAKAHMQEVVDTCVEWGRQGMPKEIKPFVLRRV